MIELFSRLVILFHFVVGDRFSNNLEDNCLSCLSSSFTIRLYS